MGIPRKPAHSRQRLSSESVEAARRDRAGRALKPVPLRIPTVILDAVDEAIQGRLATIPRTTYIIEAVEAKVDQDEKTPRVRVPTKWPEKQAIAKMTLRLPMVLNNRVEKALQHSAYQSARTSKNSYIVGAIKEHVARL